jgi:hypothetical protein
LETPIHPLDLVHPPKLVQREPEHLNKS